MLGVTGVPLPLLKPVVLDPAISNELYRCSRQRCASTPSLAPEDAFADEVARYLGMFLRVEPSGAVQRQDIPHPVGKSAYKFRIAMGDDGRISVGIE